MGDHQADAITTTNAVWKLLRKALADPTIYFVEEHDHAEDYWRRQAERVLEMLDSDAWREALDEWVMGRDG